MSKPFTAWTVLNMTKWDSLDSKVMGLRGNILVEPKEMIGFMPIFSTREAAVKWNRGDDSAVREIMVGLNKPEGGI